MHMVLNPSNTVELWLNFFRIIENWIQPNCFRCCWIWWIVVVFNAFILFYFIRTKQYCTCKWPFSVSTLMCRGLFVKNKSNQWKKIYSFGSLYFYFRSYSKVISKYTKKLERLYTCLTVGVGIFMKINGKCLKNLSWKWCFSVLQPKLYLKCFF